MITRRRILQLSSLTILGSQLPAFGGARLSAKDLDEILAYIRGNQLGALPIGLMMGQIGQLFLDVPYVGGTLEGPGPEECRVRFDGLDCVTYFENVLGLARMARKGTLSRQHLVDEITYTRYRDGLIDGYLSRLHYTAEWIENNVQKGTVEDITRTLLGGERIAIAVNFMSTHPQYYTPLKDDPDMIKKAAEIEERINAIPRWYVPKGRIASIENELQTGDIIAIATAKSGLDYSHTGMIYVDNEGIARFMHASTTRKKVVLDISISEYMASVQSHTGITVVRPR